MRTTVPLLRLNEHYVSVQGEGPNVGKMTQFVRFSGCNMRCPGWPCDTQHAILPALYKNDPKLDSSHLISKVLATRASTGAAHVCLTGGEPFMQDNGQLKFVCVDLLNFGFTIDFFTNGSFVFPPWTNTRNISLVMDWKLTGSGEPQTAIDIRRANATTLQNKDAVKFVVSSYADLHEAVAITNQENLGSAEIYVGLAWGKELTDDNVVEFLKEHQLPWRLNVQLHKHLWPNIERGI